MAEQMISAGQAEASEGWRTIRHFAYVDRPFRDIRRALTAAPQRVLTDTTELRVRRAGFDVGRDVRMVMGDIAVGIHNARIPVRWEDAGRPGFFPILDATLEVAPVKAGRHGMTQLGLFGRYRPPFGRLGVLADQLAGHQIVVESVEGFLDELVERLLATVPMGAPEDTPEPEENVAPDRPGRRRIVLPVDRLDRSHGAAGLALQLLGVRGVLDATVNPTTGLAIVDYDGTTCRLADLLQLLEAPAGPPDTVV
jgi:hypothetical protein